MADLRLTGLTELTAAPASDDLVYIVDVSDTTDDITGSSRKIRTANLLASKAEVAHTHSTADITDKGNLLYTVRVNDTVTAITRPANATYVRFVAPSNHTGVQTAMQAGDTWLRLPPV